ncbi:hypothetical protein [Melittangium boletus]|uniref:hypothetical protein n=1 Tax=Melittangium boletus TaxID=83453 RepID=UPI003DA23157
MLTWAEVGPEHRMAKRSSSCPDEEKRRNPFRLGVEPGAAWQAHGGRFLPDAHLLKGKAMDKLGNIVFDNQEIENERLELTDARANFILGPNLTLRNRTIVLQVSARRLSFMMETTPNSRQCVVLCCRLIPTEFTWAG